VVIADLHLCRQWMLGGGQPGASVLSAISALFCAANQVADSEAAMTWIKQKLEHNNRTHSIFSFLLNIPHLNLAHTPHMQGMLRKSHGSSTIINVIPH